MSIPGYFPQQASLKAYYDLSDVNDSTAGANTLTNNNTVTFSAAKVGNGANLSAANKYLSRAGNLGLINSNCTFIFWFKQASEIGSGGAVLFSHANSNAGSYASYALSYEYNGGTRRLAFVRTRYGVAAETCYFNATLGTSDFHLIVCTWDGSNILITLDGVAGTPTASSGAGSGSPGDYFYIGHTSTGLVGLYDEFAVLSVALSLAEINTVYKLGVVFGGAFLLNFI